MKKSDNNEILLKNIIIIGIGTILTKLISFIMTPFYSSWLSTSEYGIYDLLSTYVLLCVPFATLQIEQAVYRFIMEDKDNSNAVFKTAFKMLIIMLFLSSFIVYLIMHVLNYKNEIVFSFIFYFVSISLYNISSEYLRGKDMLTAYSIHNIIVGVITVIASIIFVYYMQQGVAGLLFVYALAYCVATVDIIVRYNPLKTKGNKSGDLKEMLHYSIPLIPNVLSWWIINVSDRTIINIILGNFYNGIYGICCKIPTMLSLIFSIFNLSFQQLVMHNINENSQKQYYNFLIKKVIKVLFSGSIAIIGVTPIIYYQFLNKDYWDGISSVPVLLAGAIMLSLAQYVGDLLLAKKHTRIIGVSTVIGAIINIILNIFTIPNLGIMGASISTMISCMIMFAVRFYSMRSYFSYLDVLLMFIYIVIYFIISIYIIAIGNNLVINVINCLLGCLLFFILNRDVVFGILKKIVTIK